MPYELFEHTADLGLRVRAADLNTLFIEAAEALFAAVLDDLGGVRPLDCVEIKIDGTDREFLLFDWLRELLRISDEEKRLFVKFEVIVTETGLVGKAWGELVDRNRHELAREVKAITYHELKVEPTETGWLAEVIVDI